MYHYYHFFHPIIGVWHFNTLLKFICYEYRFIETENLVTLTHASFPLVKKEKTYNCLVYGEIQWQDFMVMTNEKKNGIKEEGLGKRLKRICTCYPQHSL